MPMPRRSGRSWAVAGLLALAGGLSGCEDRDKGPATTAPSPPASAPRTADQPQGSQMGAQPGASDMASAGGAGGATDGGGSAHTASPIGSGQGPGIQPSGGTQADGGPATERR